MLWRVGWHQLQIRLEITDELSCAHHESIRLAVTTEVSVESSAELDGAMTRRWAVDNEAPMLFPIGFTVPTEHVSDFQLGAIHGAGLGLRGPGRGSLTGVWKQVERNGSAAYLAGCNSQVPGSGRQAAMAEQQLNGADISALLQQVHRKAMPQGMRRDGFANAALPVSLLEGLPDSLPADVATSDIARNSHCSGLVSRHQFRRISKSLEESMT